MSAMRRADEPSLVLEMRDEQDWPGLMAALRSADLCRNLRLQLGGYEHRPFSHVASMLLDWAFDPASGLVEDVGAGRLPACGDKSLEEWQGVGRLLAKCAMDAVEVRSPMGDLFFRYLGTGRACMQLQPTMELLAEHYPEQAGEWSALLARRLGGGTPELTTHSHAGFDVEGAADEPVCDGNKRDVVRRWARHLLVVQRKAALDAAHHGFVEVRSDCAAARVRHSGCSRRVCGLHRRLTGAICWSCCAHTPTTFACCCPETSTSPPTRSCAASASPMSTKRPTPPPHEDICRLFCAPARR